MIDGWIDLHNLDIVIPLVKQQASYDARHCIVFPILSPLFHSFQNNGNVGLILRLTLIKIFHYLIKYFFTLSYSDGWSLKWNVQKQCLHHIYDGTSLMATRVKLIIGLGCSLKTNPRQHIRTILTKKHY